MSSKQATRKTRKTVNYFDPQGGKSFSRPKCNRCDKVLYTSKHDARMSLTGQLRSKSIRVYPCPERHGNYHVTKEGSTNLR
jgi:uncharacterized protein YlaI